MNARAEKVRSLRVAIASTGVPNLCFKWEERLAVCKEVPSLFEELLSALRGNVDISETAVKIRRVDGIIAALREFELRPRINSARSLGDSISRMRDAIDVTLEAAESRGMDVAQRLAEKSQNLVESAAEHLLKAVQFDELNTGPQGVVSLSAARDTMHLATGMLDLRPSLLRDIDLEMGSGAERVVAESIASSFFDLDRFEALRREVEKALISADFARVFRDPQWVTFHQTAQERAMGQARRLQRTLGDESVVDYELLDAFMDLIDDLREVRLRHVLSLMLAATGDAVPAGGFGKQFRTGTAILRSIEKWPGLDMGSVLDEGLRQVAAHRDYSLSEGDVHLNVSSGTPLVLRPQVFIDRVLAHLELITALECGVAAVMSAQRVHVPLSERSKEVLVSYIAEHFLELFLDGHVDTVDEGARVLVSCGAPPANMQALASGLSSVLPARIESVLIRPSNGEEWSANLRLYREEVAGRDGDASLLLLLRALAATERGEQAAPAPFAWEELARAVIVESCKRPVPEAAGRLVEARRLLHSIGCDEGVADVREFLGYLRSGKLSSEQIPASFLPNSRFDPRNG